MDGDGIAERVWLEAIGQLDAERVAHGTGIGVLAGALWRGDGVSVASGGLEIASLMKAQNAEPTPQIAIDTYMAALGFFHFSFG